MIHDHMAHFFMIKSGSKFRDHMAHFFIDIHSGSFTHDAVKRGFTLHISAKKSLPHVQCAAGSLRMLFH